jgi:DNA-binding transcriptional MerR regulator
MTEPDRAPARYPIRAVSKMTGIAIDTLRAWERRYGVVTPTRDDRGRLYSDADVVRLRLLQQATAMGHSVGRIATLADEDLQRLASPQAGAAAGTTPRAGPAIDTAALAAALDALDSVAIDHEFSRLASVLPPLELVRDVLLPTLRDVGDQWNRRRGGIAHEHLISATVRNLLGSFLRIYGRREGTAGLVFATPAGERHELGILSGAMLAASHGLRVSYLGPDLPVTEILADVDAAGARVLVVGLTMDDAGAAEADPLRAIANGLPAGVELWVGGRGWARANALPGGRGLGIPDFDVYLEQLRRIALRTP